MLCSLVRDEERAKAVFTGVWYQREPGVTWWEASLWEISGGVAIISCRKSRDFGVGCPEIFSAVLPITLSQPRIDTKDGVQVGFSGIAVSCILDIALGFQESKVTV